MGKNNEQLLKIASKYLGYGGYRFRKFCGLPSGAAWCNAFVDYVANEGGVSSLYFNGKKYTYCPTSMKWCKKNLAMIPPYLAMPMDIIFFDWEKNDVPNHIGFVRERLSCDEIRTIEGNTSGGIVANRRRSVKYVQAIYRPHFKATYKLGQIEVDGLMGYNTWANLQKALGVEVDGIAGLKTIKALQKKVGVTQDGAWGVATSKAVQKKLCGFSGKSVDGLFGANSVKALQRWINKQNTVKKTETKGDKIAKTAESYVGKVKYVKGGTNLKTGVDCTGFVQAIYGLNGIKLDNKLSSWGKSIGKDVSKAKAGDIFTYKDSTGIHHGIYVGSGYVVHAANKKEGVKKSKWNSMSRPLVGIRRRWK